MWWRTLHSGLWYIIVVLFCHTKTLQTHTDRQTPTHTILAQPGMFASPCLHQVFTCARPSTSREHQLHRNPTKIGPEFGVLHFCSGEYTITHNMGGTDMYGFSFESRLRSCNVCIARIPLFLPNFPRNDMLFFLRLSPSYHCETNFFPGKGGWVGAQHTLPPRCDSY